MGVGPKPLVLGGTTAVLGTAGTAAGGQLLHAGGGQHCRLRENHGCPHHHRQLWHPVAARIVAKLIPTKNLRSMDISSISGLGAEPPPAPRAIPTARRSHQIGSLPIPALSSLCRFFSPINEAVGGIGRFLDFRWKPLLNVQATREPQASEVGDWVKETAPDRTPEPKPHSLRHLRKAQAGLWPLSRGNPNLRKDKRNRLRWQVPMRLCNAVGTDLAIP